MRKLLFLTFLLLFGVCGCDFGQIYIKATDDPATPTFIFFKPIEFSILEVGEISTEGNKPDKNCWTVLSKRIRGTPKVKKIVYGIAPVGYEVITPASPLEAGKTYRVNALGGDDMHSCVFTMALKNGVIEIRKE